MNPGLCHGVALGAMLLGTASVSIAQSAVFNVNVHSPQHTLYTDPYNGNEVKIGGFSGLFPVPG